ncbi:hypothetical protein [Kitasatospora cineracea]|uniref:hypothetical protein n=1 Tax=Kitasatospora cineracea TaxID=88074 RepID=UPI0037FCFED5
MSGIDWGSAPAWVSAFLTSGSLGLGFYILLRDRRKEEITEAAKVFAWTEHDGDVTTTKILNGSASPITSAQVLVEIRGGNGLVLENYGFNELVMPGETAGIQTDRRIDGPGSPKLIPWSVEFATGDGTRWVRDLWTGGLHRHGYTNVLHAGLSRRKARKARRERIKRITRA